VQERNDLRTRINDFRFTKGCHRNKNILEERLMNFSVLIIGIILAIESLGLNSIVLNYRAETINKLKS